MPASIDARALVGDLAEQQPGVGRPVEQVAWQLRWQAAACARMGSPLYALLLARAADDVEAGGACWEVLRDHVAPGRGDALALRFMAAAHRLVLTGRAPALARHYPSAGGTPEEHAVWPALRETVEAHAGPLAADVARPCQTNEVGRAAGLVFGFLEVAAAGLPLRLLELGAAAGLNLRWDRFRYGGGGAAWGPPDSPVDLGGHWQAAPPRTDVEAEVVGRAGCDLDPIDPASDEGRLALRSSVWADQADRLARLDGALAVAGAVPARIDQAPADAWLADALAPEPGTATVVYQSIVEEYLPAAVRERVRGVVRAAGARASGDATVHWLRMEPETMLRSHAVTLESWPGGGERLVATCGAHGAEARPASPRPAGGGA